MRRLTSGSRGAVRWLALCVLAAAAAGLGGGLVASPALAGSFVTVTTTADKTAVDGLCSLREAVLYAQNMNGGDTDCGTVATGTTTIIVPAGHYAVGPGSGDAHLRIGPGGPGPVTIAGAGMTGTVIDGRGNTPRLLLVAADATVVIKDLTLRGGAGKREPGGGIDNAGTLTLNDVTVTDNHIQGPASGADGAGGGIYNTGTLKLLGSTISGNSSAGGLAGVPQSTINPCVYTPVPGQPGSDGGGLSNQGGRVTVTGTTLTGNTTGSGGNGSGQNGQLTNPANCSSGTDGGGGAHGGDGGAIFNNGFITLAESAVYGNTTGPGGAGGSGVDALNVGGFGGEGGDGGPGAGIASNGMLTVVNTTIAGNTTGDGGSRGFGGYAVNTGLVNTIGRPGGGGHGAGVWQENGQSTVQESTVTGNVTGKGNNGTVGANAPPPGSGIEVLAGELTEIDTIASNNDCYAWPGAQIKDGLAAGDGHLNLSYPTSTCPGIVANPLLQPLHDNGGPTQTTAIALGSAALDRIPPAIGAGCTQTDQRGTARPQPSGGRCDIGAFEAAP